MAVTKERPRNVRTPDVQELEAMWHGGGDGEVGVSLGEGPRKSRPLLAAWIVVLFGLVLFTPQSSDSVPSISLWNGLLLFAFTGALVATLVGLGQEEPWRFKASALAAGLGLVLGIACAVTHHHAGTWWLAETGAFAALLAATGLSARRPD
jgi:peptidoglycan/LPS O-acetylase OafA/YrhL